MLKWIFLIFITLFLIGCGNGRAGGPDDEIANPPKITVKASNGETDSVVPYKKKKSSGSKTFEIELKKGVNLVDFSQVAYYEEDKESDALLTIRDENGVIKSYITNKSKDNISDASELKFLYLEETGKYTLIVDMPDNRDNWAINFIHKSQLNSGVQSVLKDPVIPTSIEDDDTLYPYQWHLKNTGQSEFVIFDAIEGNDINVEPVWAMGYQGDGITVAVIDQGVEINHPDLIGNIDIKNCWNYNTRSYDTTPSNTANAHGTAVAGIIAASGWNGIGGRGVAPQAKIVSYNMLEAQGIVNYSLALESLLRGIEDIDIYNNSWGYTPDGTLFPNSNINSIYDQFFTQLAYGTKHGRDGKGAIYVKSAGNDRQIEKNGVCIPYWNANFSPIHAERYMIIVGASNANGLYSGYSTPGSNLLVNAPGGSTQLSFLELDMHHIATTDLTSKYAGYDYQDDNLIDYHFNAIGNENYDYTNRMNGTSAAGPNVAGVTALMLEANPNLTWRDVRYILARTATQFGENRDNYSVGNLPALSFNNNYGFGRVNAKLAVDLARIWTNLREEDYDIDVASSVVSFNDVADSNMSKTGDIIFYIDGSFSVEYVNIEFSLDDNETQSPGTRPNSSNIQVDLESPNGTISNLIHAPNGLNEDAEFVMTRLGSNAFLDENSNGIWRLRIKEVDSRQEPFKDASDIRAFKIEDLFIEVYGH